MKQPVSILAMVAATQAVWASQVPSNAEIQSILAERIQGFEKSVSIVVGVIEPEGRRVVAYRSMGVNDPRPATGDTLYEIGSISKVFTSLILADMVERGEVKLDDPVVKYLPPGVRVPERNGKQITLYDLSTHRSGLPRMPSNFDPKDPTNPYIDYPIERMYEFLSNYTLPREIGAEYEYSNLGAGLLGDALAHRAGTDYESLVRERVLNPLGMTSTGISLTSDLRSRLAAGHSSAFRLMPAPHWDFTQAFAGAGALRSSANDLLKFLAANLGYTRTPLAASMARMLKVRRDVSENLKIGLGWRIESQKEIEIVQHGGATYAYRAFAGYDPASRAGVVVLSNYNGSSGIDDIGIHLLNPKVPLDVGTGVKPRDLTAVSIDLQLLDAYAGRYSVADNQTWTVRRDGARMFMRKLAEPEFEIFPEGNHRFFPKIADALFTFYFDKGLPGRASGLTLHWGFLDPERGKRVE